MYNDVKKTNHLSTELMSESWQGTSYDGQYQAKEYDEQLRHRLEHCDLKSDVVWDPPHLIDLAMKDVFKGKVRKSAKFLKRLVDHSAMFHHLCVWVKYLFKPKNK